jgi:hypothetical protein
MRNKFNCLIVAIFYSFFGLAVLISISCGSGGGGGGSSPTTATPTYSIQDWQNLYDHNAQATDGYTHRWPGTVITYNVNHEYFRRWEGSTKGKIQFEFVSYQPSNGISVWLAPDLNAAGATIWLVNKTSRHIEKAGIFIHPDYWNPTDGPHVLTHEAGHALGFAVHTNDGCIMDPSIGARNYISDAVALIMTHLYSYPPNTNVTANMLQEVSEQYPIIEKDDGSLLIKAPRGDYYVKEVDKDTLLFSNGPFYNGRVEPLPELQP